MTPTYKLYEDINNLYVKRDDLYPFSFGGNKARKGILFYEDIKKKNADYIVTYGSSSSNHARVMANIAALENIPCIVISPEEIKKETFNKKIIESFGAKFVFCKVSEVAKTIDETMDKLRKEGYNPYFVMGGGHGNIGTEAYVRCYSEIKEYESENKIVFDYVFFASGTGTTQAGLVAGKLLCKDECNIVGISIARSVERGKAIVINSVREYLPNLYSDDLIEKNVIFDDNYISGGYGENNFEIEETIAGVMKNYGIPLDETYTGKAWYGMNEYIKANNIAGKNILFIHTGGTPLYFDWINKGSNND